MLNYRPTYRRRSVHLKAHAEVAITAFVAACANERQCIVALQRGPMRPWLMSGASCLAHIIGEGLDVQCIRINIGGSSITIHLDDVARVHKIDGPSITLADWVGSVNAARLR